MPVRPYHSTHPMLASNSYIDDTAVIIGNVSIGEDSSVWPTAVLRGDVNTITVGSGTNIQDGSICHVTHRSQAQPDGVPLVIGDFVTVGHLVMLHACTIGNYSLIGMGSIVLDEAVIEPEVLLGAGSLVPPGAKLDGGYLWLGRPAKKIRRLTKKELAHFDYSAQHYIRLKNSYL